MLVKTKSLRRLLAREDMTSNDIKARFWLRDGNIYSLLPEDCFISVLWVDLPRFRYAVMSYQWTSYWHALARFILEGDQRVAEEYMWVDSLCLDQTADGRMKTIRRSDEIYSNAKEYHLMEIGSVFRGWVLFELCSAKKTPTVHYSNNDHAMIQTAMTCLRREGFDGSQFTDESDRPIVTLKITTTYGSVEAFNTMIIDIVENILPRV